ncbi:hybrid sensor histidine kinase/response regulator [Hyphomicrobium sp.]|uniref:hybrid sensor histidine kinase/response regulator n=1 Tax=Hyphomicrobium sp. TaxID=82 RepID=UPI002E36EF3D|nr:ATP-binding protein [Hyphomicrobium sp.]HEX2842533.1 ATP-binding protein [Hyphomicrobium sp.]
MAEDKSPKFNTDAPYTLSESQISAILTIAADAIIALDETFRITLFNDGAAAIFGYAPAEILGHPLDILIPERMRTNHHHHVAEFSASPVAARKMGERQEIFARRKDGSEFPADASIAKQMIGGHKTYMVVLRDVTDRKRAEAALAAANSELEARVADRTKALEAEIRRREEAHAALIQAQRMEAFGQLTGGVAHDFNNLLTIITGNLELLSGQSGNGSTSAYLKRAADAADMGASLTKRLLTFARRRHLTPQILDVNLLILNLTEIMRRSLGEHIALTTLLDGNVWRTRVDPSELENAILNLAINARDAMPTGGSLVIETRNVSDAETSLPTKGDFIMISVGDTGCGMSPEVLEHAFEPFFTTKETGRGTGLGLSTLYGFAEQSGGHATILSAPGQGTTVNLYLPRSDEGLAAETSLAETIPLSEDSEVVLVVEDNPEVRELTLQRVEGLGYVAREAENGPAAIRSLEADPDIQIVLSDIVMAGGISGYDLAKWIGEHKPHVRVLLTTGYAPEETTQEPAADLPILRKPYKRIDLALALREAVRGRSGS